MLDPSPWAMSCGEARVADSRRPRAAETEGASAPTQGELDSCAPVLYLSIDSLVNRSSSVRLRSDQGDFPEIVVPIVAREIRIPDDNPERAARILARKFFVELRRNELTDEQIIGVASELIRCLTERLEQFEQRIDSEG